MKINSKTFIPLLLVVVILSSCNGSISTPSINSTGEMEPASVGSKTPLAETPLTIPTATLMPIPFPSPSPFPPTPVAYFSFPVDRHDPESVIRAYFDAWERSDSTAMTSVLFRSNGQFIFEPMKSLEILEIQLVSDSSPTERVYTVLYDVQWVAKTGSGQMLWSFYLSWDVNRDSWLITNYGFG